MALLLDRVDCDIVEHSTLAPRTISGSRKRGSEPTSRGTPSSEAIMKPQLIAIALAAFLATPLLAGRGGGGSSHSGGSHGGSTTRSSSSSSDSKPMYVNGYTRKDGTYVSGYWRSAPGTAVHNPKNERETAAWS